jgi:serine/threonine protein phosphatase PrpC
MSRADKLDAAGGQIQGARRYQEDAWHIDRFGKRELLAVVADGLGGHPAGDVASREAVKALREHFRRRRRTRTGAPREWLQESVLAADRHLAALQRDNVAWQGMATTLVALYLRAAAFWAVSVGDSYLLLRREQRLARLNELHSEEGGVTSCVGFHLTRVDVADELVVEPGDRYLLATDGIVTLGDAGIESVLTEAPDAGAAVRRALHGLDERALPGQDNATVVAVFA